MRAIGWLRAVLAAVLLLLCLVTCWYCLETTEIRADNAYLEMQLDTSHSRERKQQMEYDEVAEALPEAQAALAEAQPLTDAAKETETELRAQRKQLRSEVADLESASSSLSDLNTQLAEIITATQEIQALIEEHTAEETAPCN